MRSQYLLHNKPLFENIEKWAIIAVIFLFTFPAYQVALGIGLDASYQWGLNWLFAHDYNTLKQLIYPFGPLAFLKMPAVIGNNLLISILFYSTLKFGFLWLLFELSKIMQNTNKSTTILIAFIVSYFTDIDFLLIGSCLILNLIYYKNSKIIYFTISVFIAFIGLFIKTSIGVSSLSVIAVSVLISLYYSKNIVLFLKHSGIIVFIGFVAGMLVFGNPIIYFRFLTGALMLSGGYGDTLSLHPPNNWALLFPFIIIMIIFPFIYKDKDLRIAYLISLFPLFASWKHSFIREDITHYRILITFLFVYWGIIFIVSSKKRFLPVIAALSILLLYVNMMNIQTSSNKEIKREIVAVNNFLNILKHKQFKQSIRAVSEKNISDNKLNPEILKIIGDETVDVYPWEFSYIAANQLKWKPRKTIELGASTSRWASQKASENYLFKEDAPQYVLFHAPRDVHGGKFGSLDNRYILNDEPLVIFNLLNNYTLIEKNDKFLLLKRNTASRVENVCVDELQEYRFGEWIQIPYNSNEIARLMVFSSNTFLGKINKFFYKETEYIIDYQFENDFVMTYRYIPCTAVDGLWCNPFVFQPNTNSDEFKTVKIRLRNANSNLVKKSFKAQFQHIKLKDNEQDFVDTENLLFQKSVTPSKEIFVNSLQQYDNESSKWNNFTQQLESKEISYTYLIDLDSLFSTIEVDSLLVEANIMAANSHNARLVISTHLTVEDFYSVTYLSWGNQTKLRHYFYLNSMITRNKHASGFLKAYIYNYGDSPVFIDNFRLLIKDGTK